MTAYVAFLRAINVGGTGKLPMSDLRKMCKELGFDDAKTYIASGNVAFTSKKAHLTVKKALEERLGEFAGKPIAVFVRTAAEIREVLNKNPFSDRDPKRTLAIFLDRKPALAALAAVSGKKNEELQIGAREIYVYYSDGISKSRLKIPAAISGTARNMNTIRKMAGLADSL